MMEEPWWNTNNKLHLDSGFESVWEKPRTANSEAKQITHNWIADKLFTTVKPYLILHSSVCVWVNGIHSVPDTVNSSPNPFLKGAFFHSHFSKTLPFEWRPFQISNQLVDYSMTHTNSILLGDSPNVMRGKNVNKRKAHRNRKKLKSESIRLWVWTISITK